ncbi:MAG: DUF2461 domain-containing protein [Bacteroidota bacterium]
MITKDYQRFFRELAANNSKAWFQANRPFFEQSVKAPFLALISQLLPQLQLLEPDIPSSPKATLFRINRDLRFSKDKTPYHLLMKASFVPHGKKSGQPGFYLGIGADTIHVGGGLFKIPTRGLQQLRSNMVEQPAIFHGILRADRFLHHFGSLQGTSAQRLPKKWQANVEQIPELTKRQFYAMQKLQLADYFDKEELEPRLMAAFRAVHPLNTFLQQATATLS